MGFDPFAVGEGVGAGVGFLPKMELKIEGAGEVEAAGVGAVV